VKLMTTPPMTTKPDRDALHHLADALADDIAHTPSGQLLAEVAEDHGSPRAYASEFDRIIARADRRLRKERLSGRLQVWLSAWLIAPLAGPVRRPAMIAVAGLAVLLGANVVYLEMSGYYDSDLAPPRVVLTPTLVPPSPPAVESLAPPPQQAPALRRLETSPEPQGRLAPSDEERDQLRRADEQRQRQMPAAKTTAPGGGNVVALQAPADTATQPAKPLAAPRPASPGAANRGSPFAGALTAGRVPPAADPVARVTNYVAQYDGGDCFLINVLSISGNAAVLEGLGASAATFDKFGADFKAAMGFAADVGMRLVSEAQCPAVDFVRQTRSRGASPVIRIESYSQLLSGTIDAPGSEVELFLVPWSGTVQNVTALLKGGNPKTFSMGVAANGAEGSSPFLLVAVATPAPSDVMRPAGSVLAKEFFPKVLSDATRALTAAAHHINLAGAPLPSSPQAQPRQAPPVASGAAPSVPAAPPATRAQ
jgi:hypothetical protein